MSHPFASIIILNYNGAHYLPACLKALQSQSYPQESYEVIVADNGSSDGSLELLQREYPWAKIVDNQQNLGFAEGNNRAILASRGEFVILLNNDTIPEKDWLANLAQVAQDHPQAGLVTGHLQLFYDQLNIEIQTQSFKPENDTRDLGIQIFSIDTGTERGVVQYLAGFHNYEQHPSGKTFRWMDKQGQLGVPIPPGDGSWSMVIELAAPRPVTTDVPVRFVVGSDQLSECIVQGENIQTFTIPMPASTRKLGKRVEQNTGSLIFHNGASRDRGTYVRTTEVFYETDNGQYNTIEPVFAGCGASLLLRRSAIDEIGLLDGDFFMYYEDTDLSWRAWLSGWQVLYAPQARVRHIHCGTTQEWSPFFLHLTERNRLAMVFKNGGWNQVLHVWGGYTLKVLNLGWATATALWHHPQWRQKAAELKIHFKVAYALLRQLPSLIRKRITIQRQRKISPKELEYWFRE